MVVRAVAAAGVLVSAAVHLVMWFDGVRHQHVVGPAFMVNAVGGAVVAVLLLTWSHWVPPLLAVGFGLSTLGAFTLASTVGLFGTQEKWQGFYVFGAASAELVAIVVGLALVLEDPDPVPAPARRGGAHARVGGSPNRSDSA